MRLDIHRVSKTFRGKVRALDGVSLTATTDRGISRLRGTAAEQPR
jgi:hypothetical protein